MKKTIGTFTVLFMVFLSLSFQGIYAQPVTPAPTPAHDPGDVLAVFSDHYNKNTLEPQGWTAEVSVIMTIEGTNDHIVKAPNLGNSPVYTGGWAVQNKQYVHMDIYSDNGGSFYFGLSNYYSLNVNFPSNTYSPWPITVAAGQWVSIDVPVLKFFEGGLNSAADVVGLRFLGGGTFYIDNIYAYGEKGVYVEYAEIPPAPAPTVPASDVKSVYSDLYPYHTSDKEYTILNWGGILAKELPVKDHPDDHVLQLNGLGECTATIDTWKIADKPYIHIDVYYAGGGDGTFGFGLNNADWSGNNFIYIDYEWSVPVQGQWIGIDVPGQLFATAGLNLNEITQIRYVGSGNFYIDNLYAYSFITAINDVTHRPSTVTATHGVINAAFDGKVQVKLYSITGQLLDQTTASGSLTSPYPIPPNSKSHKQSSNGTFLLAIASSLSVGSSGSPAVRRPPSDREERALKFRSANGSLPNDSMDFCIRFSVIRLAPVRLAAMLSEKGSPIITMNKLILYFNVFFIFLLLIVH
jgi:hypothetical protein